MSQFSIRKFAAAFRQSAAALPLRVTNRLIRLLMRIQIKLQAQRSVPLVAATPPVQPETDPMLLQPIGALPNLAGSHMYETETYRKLFYLMEERGVHITPNHFYSPIPDARGILSSKLWEKESELAGIDLNIDQQLNLLRNVFPTFQEEYDTIPPKKTDDLLPHEFHFYNGMYDFLDALVLYCMVRHLKPKRILEVGSGWSTRMSAQAALRNGNTQLTCIEPYPDPVLVKGFPGLDSLIVKKVEEVDLSIFQSLGEDDILFIDTSHVIKTGGDVTYLYLEVLPRLRKGVVIHIHDIFFPQEYVKWWLTHRLLFWNEQYLLQAFLIYNDHFRVVYASNLMRLKYMEEIKKTFPKCPSYESGQSLWMQKIL